MVADDHGGAQEPSELEAFLAEVRARPAPKESFRTGLQLDPERHLPTGNTQHFYGAPDDPRRFPAPTPSALAIVRYEGEGGYYLLGLDAHGVELTDTWHETLEDAKDQAEFELGVSPSEWPSAEP